MDISSDKVAKEPSVVRQELEEVRDVLSTNNDESMQLEDRPIMVPITTKAFFAGKLKPNRRSKTQEEQVMVKMTKDYLVELDRSEAIDYLDRRIASLSTFSTTIPSPKSSLVDNLDAAQAHSSMEGTNHETEALSFFEIREELDENGNEIKAEAINVAKQLEALQEKESGLLAKSMPPSSVARAKDEVMTIDDDDDGEPKKRAPMTEEEYTALSLRLDELARLEEEAETKKAANQVSSKKLQSKGWSKGFLNTAKPKTKRTKERQSTSKSTETRTVNSMSSESTTTPVVEDGRQKQVGFQQQDEIREIPRIGQRSASELKQQQPPEAEVAGEGVSLSSRRSRAIEQTVFSGVIRERTSLDPSSTAVAETSPSSNPPPRKKLSRFAQERQQQQR